MTTQDSADFIPQIRQLKKDLGAVILAHNYQVPDIYDVADFIGDSLELARQAQGTKARLIIFSGVRFMAETAKLLNPEARVVLARADAGCEMARMITAEALKLKQRELGSVYTVAYVNTPADVKAEVDICCTSSNAVKVVQSVPGDRRILFVPDENLAAWVSRETGRELIPWPGFCYVHAGFRPEDVRRAREEHPGALIVVHPECRLNVIEVADRVASTSGMLKLAADHHELVLGTEIGMCHRVRREYPDRLCYPLGRTAVCRNMKLTRLGDVLQALQGNVPEITIPDHIAVPARTALERMTAIN